MPKSLPLQPHIWSHFTATDARTTKLAFSNRPWITTVRRQR